MKHKLNILGPVEEGYEIPTFETKQDMKKFLLITNLKDKTYLTNEYEYVGDYHLHFYTVDELFKFLDSV